MSATGARFGEDAVVCCVVDGAQYALRAADVRSIARAEQMHALAAGEGRVGVLRARGADVPVYALGALLARRPAASPFTTGRHIVVTGDGEAATAWLVDRVARTPLPEDADLMPLPAIVGAPARAWFDGVLRADGRLLPLLAADRLRDPVQPERKDSGRPSTDAPPTTAAATGGQTPGAARLAVLFSTAALPRWDASRYAIAGGRLVAVVQSLPAVALPGCATRVAGVALWRDALVPIIDHRPAADRAVPGDRERYLVARCGQRAGGGFVAFAVAPDVVLHRAAADDRQIAQDVEKPPFVSAVFNVGGEAVALVDLDALVDAGADVV